MITGDYHHTAIAVAKDIGMVRPGGQVIIIDSVAPERLQTRKSILSSHYGSVAADPSTLPQASPFNCKHPPCTSLEPSGRLQRLHSPSQPWPDSSQPPSDPCRSCSAPCQASHQDQKQALQHQMSLQTRGKQVSWGPVLQSQDIYDSDDQQQHQHTRITAAPQTAGDSPLQAVALQDRAGLDRLRFCTARHGQLGPAEALSALAEGQMQCAVTGTAFEQLLQQEDLSILETVMRSAVVFSRMQPHQKGQVMDLLSMQGIHQLFNGQPRYIPVRPPSTPSCMQ